MFGRKRKAQAKTTLAAPDGVEILDISSVQSEGAALATISKLFDVYQPGVIFGTPTTMGDNTVMTASEVNVVMGLGFGHGSGGDKESNGEGGGGGGGGAATGRPVAVVIVNPHGVRVEPIFDVTKVTLAFFTMLGAMFMTWRAMQRMSSTGKS